jgi:tripartite-type tricarboxylate transporter receptor subunit TctC
MSGIKVQLVPYRATSEVVTALRSKDIQVGIEIIPPIMGQISSGTIRALGVASKERSPLLPNVPTISESGVPGYEASSWNGLTAPPGTPPAIVNRLQQEVVRALAVPEVKQRLEEVGAVPRASTPEQIRDQIKSDYVKWKAVVEQAGIPLQ